MAITKEKKSKIIDTLRQKIQDARSVMFVNFHGLNVKDSRVLREALRKKSAQMYVSKKTLLRRALKDIGIEGSEPALDGEVAIIASADEITAAKESFQFGKAHKDHFKVLGGVLEKRYLSDVEVKSLSRIQSREILFGRLLGVLEQPLRSFLATLGGPSHALVRVLNQIREMR